MNEIARVVPAGRTEYNQIVAAVRSPLSAASLVMAWAAAYLIDAALALVGHAGVDGQSPRKLSGGEAQRTARVRALVLWPEVHVVVSNARAASCRRNSQRCTYSISI